MRTYTILGQPVGQARPKFYRCGPRVGVYEPEASVLYKRTIRDQLLRQRPYRHEPGEPLWVDICSYMRPPQRRPRSRQYPATVPDADNLIKILLDGGNEILWHDDCQICAVSFQKVYGPPGEPGKVVLRVDSLPATYGIAPPRPWAGVVGRSEEASRVVDPVVAATGGAEGGQEE